MKCLDLRTCSQPIGGHSFRSSLHRFHRPSFETISLEKLGRPSLKYKGSFNTITHTFNAYTGGSAVL